MFFYYFAHLTVYSVVVKFALDQDSFSQRSDVCFLFLLSLHSVPRPVLYPQESRQRRLDTSACSNDCSHADAASYRWIIYLSWFNSGASAGGNNKYSVFWAIKAPVLAGRDNWQPCVKTPAVRSTMNDSCDYLPMDSQPSQILHYSANANYPLTISRLLVF